MEGRRDAQCREADCRSFVPRTCDDALKQYPLRPAALGEAIPVEDFS
jgi:hypothetical protein